MRRAFALFLVLSAIAFILLLPNSRSNRNLGVRAVLADDGNPACLLPPDSGDVDSAGHKITWLPTTPEPIDTKIPPQRSGGTDCPFYRPAWQRYMVATQPRGNAPAFLTYPSFDDLFPRGSLRPGPVAIAHPLQLSLHPRNIQLPNSPTDSQQALIDRNRGDLNDINQAGPNNTVGGNLIDQHGHLVYYAIHVSP
jgi:hypothetical protein